MQCSIAIAATDLTPGRAAFLAALADSLTIHQRDPDVTVLVVADSAKDLPANLRALGDVVDAASFLDRGPQPGEIHPWYREQLLALVVPAHTRSSFTLFLTVGSFVISELTLNALIPQGRARSFWEDFILHPEWWATARSLTHRRPSTPYVGLSSTPTIFSRELARWTLEVLSLEAEGGDATEILMKAARSGASWSAPSLYSTAAGDQLKRFHHDGWRSRQTPLMSPYSLWSMSGVDAFTPSAAIGPERGLLTFVKEEAIDERDDVLDRLYSCLMPEK